MRKYIIFFHESQETPTLKYVLAPDTLTAVPCPCNIDKIYNFIQALGQQISESLWFMIQIVTTSAKGKCDPSFGSQFESRMNCIQLIWRWWIKWEDILHSYLWRNIMSCFEQVKMLLKKVALPVLFSIFATNGCKMMWPVTA